MQFTSTGITGWFLIKKIVIEYSVIIGQLFGITKEVGITKKGNSLYFAFFRQNHFCGNFSCFGDNFLKKATFLSQNFFLTMS